jgi:CheY-like chemotaxis protein
VLSLGEVEQHRLLTLSVQNRWTVRQLRRMVEKLGTAPTNTGRPRTPAALKTLMGALAQPHAFDGMETLIALKKSAVGPVLEICQRTREALGQVERFLQAGRAGEQARILVVDGDRAFMTRAQKELKKYVRSVRVARSCEEARKRIDAQISCAVIELDLDDGYGPHLASELKRRYPDIHCVLMTAKNASGIDDGVSSTLPLVLKSSGLREVVVAVLFALNAMS